MNPVIAIEIHRAGELYCLTSEQVLEQNRSKSNFEARAIAAWSLRQRFGFSFPELGRIFKLDHTTVMSAVHKVERDIRNGGQTMLAINAICLLEMSQPKAAE